jgi:hypothetical protein
MYIYFYICILIHIDIEEAPTTKAATASKQLQLTSVRAATVEIVRSGVKHIAFLRSQISPLSTWKDKYPEGVPEDSSMVLWMHCKPYYDRADMLSDNCFDKNEEDSKELKLRKSSSKIELVAIINKFGSVEDEVERRFANPDLVLIKRTSSTFQSKSVDREKRKTLFINQLRNGTAFKIPSLKEESTKEPAIGTEEPAPGYTTCAQLPSFCLPPLPPAAVYELF